MADIRTAAAVAGLAPGSDHDAALPEGDRTDAEAGRHRGQDPSAIGIGLPLVPDGIDDDTEDEQPRDWKGEPD